MFFIFFYPISFIFSKSLPIIPDVSDPLLEIDLDHGISLQEFKQCFQCTQQKAEHFLDDFNFALKEFNMKYAIVAAIFAVNIAFDTWNLTWFEDLSDGMRWRFACGNRNSEDAFNFKPRGGIKIIGRCEYTAANKALWNYLSSSLFENPFQVKEKGVCFLTSGWKFANEFVQSYDEGMIDMNITASSFQVLQDSLLPDQVWNTAVSLKRVRTCLCYEALGGTIPPIWHDVPSYPNYQIERRNVGNERRGIENCEYMVNLCGDGGP